jgi:hypothetical protein
MKIYSPLVARKLFVTEAITPLISVMTLIMW